MNLILPWPPSSNRYWRNYRGHVVMSEHARVYKTPVGWRVGHEEAQAAYAALCEKYPGLGRKEVYTTELVALTDAGRIAAELDLDDLPVLDEATAAWLQETPEERRRRLEGDWGEFYRKQKEQETR